MGTSSSSCNSSGQPNTTSCTNVASLTPGDLIKICRPTGSGIGFFHYCVYIGDNLVAHVTVGDKHKEYCTCPDDTTFVAGNTLPQCRTCGKHYRHVARQDAIDTIINGDRWEIDNSFDKKHTPLPPDEIVKRAKALLGPVTYHFANKNCEHFATWSRYDTAVCSQSKVTWLPHDVYIKSLKKSAAVVSRTVRNVMNSMPLRSSVENLRAEVVDVAVPNVL